MDGRCVAEGLLDDSVSLDSTGDLPSDDTAAEDSQPGEPVSGDATDVLASDTGVDDPGDLPASDTGATDLLASDTSADDTTDVLASDTGVDDPADLPASDAATCGDLDQGGDILCECDDVFTGDLCDTIDYLQDAAFDCGDLIEEAIEELWSATASPGITSLTTLDIAGGAQVGNSAMRIDTTTPNLVVTRFEMPAGSTLDITGYDELRFTIRALNTNPSGFQDPRPGVLLEDNTGATARHLPNAPPFLPNEGVSWVSFTMPIGGGPGWDVDGDTIDLGLIRAIVFHADTWCDSFILDIDGLSFEHAETICE